MNKFLDRVAESVFAKALVPLLIPGHLILVALAGITSSPVNNTTYWQGVACLYPLCVLYVLWLDQEERRHPSSW